MNVVAATANGPAVQGFQSFWIPGAWMSNDVVPPGASSNEGARNVEVVGSPDGETILAGWPTEEPGVWVWTLHDGTTIPDGFAAGSAYLGTATNGGESINLYPPT